MYNHKGFTLIELMIVVAIIGILAAIALPQYQSFAEKSKYTEVVLAIDTVKSAMEICLQVNDDIALCDTADKIGSDLIEAARSAYVTSVSITPTSGAITGIGTDPDASSYTLTPTSSGNWTKTGTCISNGVC